MHVDAVRRFNRFYTRRIGVLREGLLGSPYTLTEARLIYELAQVPHSTATVLGKELSLDLGYLSRLLQSLRRRGLVQAKPAPHDARHSLLSLTEKGRKAFALLNSRSRDEMADMLSNLHEAERERLIGAMNTVESLLGKEKREPQIVLRSHRPGDMGWVVKSHGDVYAREYGWDERFEALVADIAAKFIQNFDAKREACWIAELDGERVGAVLVVKDSKTIAKLRLLIVEPKARGLGLGKRLVDECIRFARDKGYKTLVLWTQANLAAARAIYRRAGFKLAKKERHRTFGYDLVGEYWELRLG
jgi:DNA-binding MarR family transcriptional regulator/GNAT superfamily N-acetyltransferase